MAEPPSAPLTVRIRFQKVDLEFSACAETTVADLRAYLHQHTNVAPSKQKLVGLPPAVADDALLTSVKLKPRLMLIGTPDAVLEAAASEHTEAIKAQATIADDLDLDIELATPAHTNELYLAKVDRRVREYKPRMLGEARTGSKLLVLDVDYTLFDHRSPAESAAELGRPFLHEFLSLAYEHNFDIIIWSATSMSWIELKMRDLGLASSAHFSFYAYYDHGAMITLQDDKYGVLDVKPLGSVWGQVKSRTCYLCISESPILPTRHSPFCPHVTSLEPATSAFLNLSASFAHMSQSILRTHVTVHCAHMSQPIVPSTSLTPFVCSQHSQWGPHNTIMFDDLSRNFLMNPQVNSLTRLERPIYIYIYIYPPRPTHTLPAPAMSRPPRAHPYLPLPAPTRISPSPRPPPISPSPPQPYPPLPAPTVGSPNQAVP